MSQKLLSEDDYLQAHRSAAKLDNLLSRSSASLRISIMSKTLTTTEVTDILQLEPDYQMNDGDVLYESSERRILSKGSHWSVRSTKFISGNQLENHLKWLRDTLFGRRIAIRLLQERGAKITIIYLCNSWKRSVSLDIDIETIQLLAQLRIDFRIDISYENTDSDY